MSKLPIDIEHEQLVDVCQHWKTRELARFGSVLRSDFSPTRDVDILVTFAEDVSWSLLDHVQMQQELETLFHRKVDLLTRCTVEQSQNPIRRDATLSSPRPLIAA